jgi:hypothetical protein
MPMTRTEHLLVILMEEAAEVAQRTSKALRFGLAEVEPGQERTNAERMNGELLDLYAVCALLVKEGALAPLMDVIVPPFVAAGIQTKQRKVEAYLRYSRECGTLTDEEPA